MFERFTADAREVVLRARLEAIQDRRPVGTEHLLIALLGDPGAAGSVLRAAGLDVRAVRDDVARLAGRGPAVLDAGDAEALRAVGIDLDAVLARIEVTFGPEALQAPAPTRRGLFGRRVRRVPAGRFGPRSKKVLELSLREAIRLRSGEIGPAHVLLGLLREGHGLGAQVLVERGADLVDLRDETERRLRPAA